MTKLILTTIFWFLTAIEFALLERVLLSWFPNVSSLYSVKKFLYEITEPILQPIRKLIDKSIFQGNGSIFDISPLIAFIVIDALKAIV